MRHVMRHTLLLIAGVLASCGPQVTALDLRDERLPVEARRWVADAQDAVVVARARQSDAAEQLRSVERWRSALLATHPVSDPAAAASLEEMARQRVALARLEVELAEAELVLAASRLTQAYAETAMRHDLDVYELGPILRETERSQQRALALRGRVQDQRQAQEEATNTWWAAYRAFVAAGGDVTPLWALED